MRPSKSLSLRFAALAFAAWVAAMDAASAQDAARDYRIAEQSLGQALREFALASNLDLLFSPDLVAGKKSSSLDGKFTVDEGLRTLLRGSGLEFSVSGSRVVISEPKIEPERQATSSSSGPQGTNGYTRLAQAEPSPSPSSSTATSASTAQPSKDSRIELEEIIVTGTNIRAAKDQFSPVKKIRREDMDLAGQDSVFEVIDSLPQNFGGGVTPDTLPASNLSGPGSASANLRGLGNEATLTLLNGRRLAPGGAAAAFVDMSAIPTVAIDRIDVMTDGASAIYGSDAIAGVVNIILRNDFDGAESRLNLSTLSDGGGNTIRVGQTVGVSGERANGLIAYEYSSEGELDANDREFSQLTPDPAYLLPFIQKHSVFGSGGVALTDRARLSLDGYYNARKSEMYSAAVIPNLEQHFQETDTQMFGGAAGLNLQLLGDWEADLSTTYSQADHLGEFINVHTATKSGTLVDARSEIASSDLSFGGSLFHVTDEAVRGVLGGHYRFESIDQLQKNRLTLAPTISTEMTRDVFAVYGELYAPLLSDSDALPGINRFALTLSARYEDYSDVGSSFAPKAGVLWSPFADLSVRGTYGNSFRAPRLNQLTDRTLAALLGVYADPQSPTSASVALVVSGTTSNLDPEEAETWTAGFDFSPQQFEGLTLRGTYFNVVYEGRIAQPSFGLNPQFRFANFTGVPTRNPSQQAVQALVASAESFSNFATFFPSLGPLSLSDVTVILDIRPTNLSSSTVEGVDLEIIYDFATDIGNWTLSLDSTILTKYEQQFSATAPATDLLNKFGNPVDLKVRGSVIWQAAPVTAALYVNYVDGYIDNGAATGPFPIQSWTTLDASMRFDLGGIVGGKAAENVWLSVSATNLFNESPPTIGTAPLRAAFYDPANSDPSGRKFSILLTKKW